MIIPQPIKPVLFGWGSCSDSKNTNIPHRLKPPKSIESSPEKVFASEGCNVILENQMAYSWSNNKYSRSPLGRKRGSPENESTPRKIAINVPIQKISQSHNHTLLLTTTKEVYGFGENTDNKLGLSKRNKNVQLPTRVNVEDCIDVAGGASSSVFLLKDGSVKVAGLGANRNTRSKILHSIPFVVPISSVACGSSHTVALSKNGKCYSFGCPDNGRLGLGSELGATMISTPRLVDIKVQMKDVVCGSAHTLLLSVDGNVYTFGWNQFGQCGVDPVVMGDVHVPTLIKGTEKIYLINAGFAHSAIVTKVDAQLFTFGNNENGQLGLGNETNQNKPIKVVHFHRDSKYSTYSVIDVDCGNLHTLALIVPVCFQEYQERKSLIRRMKCGILVLEKFARLVLMQRRMRMIRQTLKSRKEAHIQIVIPRISSPLLEQDQSEHSDESSETIHSTNDDVTQVTSTLDELVAFESEDEISKLMTKRLLRLEAYKQKKKLILLTEVKRENEHIRMFHEDLLSRKKSHQDRIERLRKRMQTRIVDETRIEKQSTLSTTANQKVQKPLQIMKKKKKTKVKNTRPMKLLTKEKNISLGRNKEPSKPKMLSKKRNDFLLERRKARLLQQALKKQQKQERIANEERQRQLHEDAAKKRQESIELERKERFLRRKKMLSNFTKKKRLHNTINTRMTEATNPNNKKTFQRSFKSVSDWNHRL